MGQEQKLSLQNQDAISKSSHHRNYRLSLIGDQIFHANSKAKLLVVMGDINLFMAEFDKDNYNRIATSDKWRTVSANIVCVTKILELYSSPTKL